VAARLGEQEVGRQADARVGSQFGLVYNVGTRKAAKLWVASVIEIARLMPTLSSDSMTKGLLHCRPHSLD
jgi:hypothetical protein